MPKHDQGYKSLFSHPEMVRDLLLGFVHEDWVEHLDFNSLEKASGEYISEELLNRDNDILWRVRCGKSWLYIYLLLEFQSTPNKWMALRVLSYICLLYQDLLKNKDKHLSPNQKLPPVFPIVIYNGTEAWNPATEINDLIENWEGDLAAYQPSFRFLFLDEHKHGNNNLETMHNLVAAIFNLEQTREPSDMVEVINSLVIWLNHPEHASLKRAIVTWIKRVLSPARLNGLDLPKELNLLEELRDMLAERVKEWPQRWLEEGRQQGLKEGWQGGKQEGKVLFFKDLLKNRFGELPIWVEKQLEQATEEQLKQWSQRLFSAQQLEDIFIPTSPKSS